MFKFVSFVFITALAFIFYLSLYNTNNVTIFLAQDASYELPLVALIVVSTCSGAFIMFIISFVNDTRRFILTRKQQRKLKKDELADVHYFAAMNHLVSQRGDEAIAELDNVLKERPNHMPAMIKLGDILRENKDFAKASEQYLRVLSLDSENFETLYKIACLMEDQGQHNDAMSYIEKILAHDASNIAALYKRRDLLERLSRWEQLVELQKSIMKLTVASKETERGILVGYKYECGRQGLEASNADLARRSFKTVLKLNPGFIPAHLGLVEVMLIEGHTEEAVEYLVKIHEQTKSIIPLIRLEDLLISTGEPSRLLKIYRIVVSASPDSDLLRLFHGKLYYRLEMLDDALEIFTYFDTTSVVYEEVHKLRGSIYLKRNQCDRAAEEFFKVLDMKKALWIPYTCKQCGYTSTQWSGRCPSCKHWDTYAFELSRPSR